MVGTLRARVIEILTSAEERAEVHRNLAVARGRDEGDKRAAMEAEAIARALREALELPDTPLRPCGLPHQYVSAEGW